MTTQFFDKPILNSPYEMPKRHWRLDESGQPTQTIDAGRRAASFVTPIPKPSKQSAAAQQSLALDYVSDDSQRYDPTGYVNEMRRRVDAWRNIPNPKDWGVTPETARLLQHWRSHNFSDIRPFFCQIEAAETMIWITEVAHRTQDGRRLRARLVRANRDAHPDLLRCALKLATGAGKTTVMAMIIAWQTVNAVRRPASNMFTSGFLVVTPGITIRDRLRVLQPNDPDNYYASRELLPPDMLRDIAKAKIVITNYHAFIRRERLNVARAGRRLLQGRRGGEPDTLETEGQMLRRVMPDLMGMRHILALNDEGHHCYREKAGDVEEGTLTGDDRREATKNNESARVWISGLEAVNRNIGVSQVVDMSATPFFLRGSGYAEGTLFPWTVCDFSLMDAIECGIVKLPRVPVSDNIASSDMPMYRALWKHIRAKMPKQGRGRGRDDLDPLSIPVELQTALQALYGHYAKTHAQWEEANIPTPPCFAIVCNNTATSKLVYEYVAGFERKLYDDSTMLEYGRMPLFRNYDEHGNPYPLPRTLLIDSEQLESGDALDSRFRKIAAAEIERFRADIVARTGDRAQADNITDQDLLREVMNTVGKEGRLGANIRCVVSVSMLTEGWDANNVTHILGVRAFGTQLLCEQVIGRALRRQSYEINDDGLFDVEYADVLGVPFDFTAQPVDVAPQKPRRAAQVRAIRPDRDHLEIRFPRVAGYRVDPPREDIRAAFTEDSKLTLSPDLVGPTITKNQGIIGEGADLTLDHLKEMRQSTLLMELTKHLIQSKWQGRDDEFPSHMYGQTRLIVKRWLDKYLTCKGGAYPAQLMYRELGDRACDLISAAIVRAHQGDRKVMAALDPFNPWGSTAFVNFNATRGVWRTDARKCHINFAVLDSGWEGEFCRVVESHPKTLAYVKNHNLGLEVPYHIGGIPRRYIPDFIVQVNDGRGADDPLNLIVEVKGYRGEDAKAKHDAMATYWIPGINNLGSYGRWAFAEFTDAYDMEAAYDRLISAAITKSAVAASVAANPSAGTLADYMKGYVGRIHASPDFSQNTSAKFAEILKKKYERRWGSYDAD